MNNLDMRVRLSATLESVARILKTHPIFVSFYEALFVFIISNSAILFLVFVRVVLTKDEGASGAVLVEMVSQAVSPAEIFVYILALLAPALWVMFYHWRARRNPIFYFALLMLQGVIIVSSSFIYGQAKFGTIENPEFVRGWAMGCYLLGLLIWYISMVYEKMINAPPIATMAPSGESIMRELG